MSKSRNLWIKLTIIFSILLIVGSYAFFNARFLISGPQIEVFEPIDGSSFDDPFVSISGQVKHISEITLDDNPIFIDESGFFKEQLLLSPGVSIIEIYARDKFGREIKKYLNLYYTGTSTKPNDYDLLEEETENDESIEEIEEISE